MILVTVFGAVVAGNSVTAAGFRFEREVASVLF